MGALDRRLGLGLVRLCRLAARWLPYDIGQPPVVSTGETFANMYLVLLLGVIYQVLCVAFHPHRNLDP
jgi:hypothetical protein